MPQRQPSIDNAEHDYNKKAKRVINVDAFGGQVTEGNYLMIVDEPSAITSYIGLAQIGTATSAAGWQIKKITTSSTLTTLAWASGTDAFTQVWDNRLALTYS